MTSTTRLGVLGGTFDPVHAGHLAVARAAQAALGLDTILLVPSLHPPHRRSKPHVSAFHRFAMVALSIADEPVLAVSDIELLSEGPSYTSGTLRALLARGLHPSQIYFVLGADAFADIATWNEYPAVLDLSHFAVVSRPGFPVEEAASQLPGLEQRMVRAPLAEERRRAESAPDVHIYLVDAETPDVSSTVVRARVAAGLSLAGLVTPAVERYIERHALYPATSAVPLQGGSEAGGRRFA